MGRKIDTVDNEREAVRERDRGREGENERERGRERERVGERGWGEVSLECVQSKGG